MMEHVQTLSSTVAPSFTKISQTRTPLRQLILKARQMAILTPHTLFLSILIISMEGTECMGDTPLMVPIALIVTETKNKAFIDTSL